MNKLTNYQIDLIKRAKQKVASFKSRNNHIILQVHTHIQLLQRTGKGVEVLEHYLATHNKKLSKVFYYEGKIYDFTHMEYERYSRVGKDEVWSAVGKFHPSKKYKL